MATWTKLASTIAASADSFTVNSAALDTKTGNATLIVVAMGVFNTTDVSATVPTDSAGNVYVKQATEADANGPQITCYACFLPTQSTTCSWSWTNASQSFPSMAVLVFHGSTGGLHAYTVGKADAAVSLHASGSVGGANDLIVSMVGAYPNTGGFAIDSSFTLEVQEQDLANNLDLAMGWIASAGTANPTWSWVNASNAVTINIAFLGDVTVALTGNVGTGSQGTLPGTAGIVLTQNQAVGSVGQIIPYPSISQGTGSWKLQRFDVKQRPEESA